jgi:amidohydrolase
VTHLVVEIEGVGGHASQPQAMRDPVVAAAQYITAAQTIVSRNLSSHEAAVVSFSTINAGRVNNVIPSRARMEGTVRTLDDAVTQRVHERLRTLGEGLGAAFGVRFDVQLEPQYPVLVNHDGFADAVAKVGGRVVGEERVSAEGVPITGGEDFAFYTREVPVAYFFLGAAVDGESTLGCHQPDFDFDDELIATGVRIFLGLVEARGGARPSAPRRRYWCSSAFRLTRASLPSTPIT